MTTEEDHSMPNSFEGWYFKQQSGGNMIAVIPAIHTDRVNNGSGSIQIIMPERSHYIELPGEVFSVNRHQLTIQVGDSVFSLKGMDLNIQSDGISIKGQLHYDNHISLRGDIMGPYQYVPFMECRHSVFSVTHTVSGSLAVNGESLDFSGGVGYIEGDRGRSFPKRYVWTQCNWDEAGPCSLMLSAAEVEPLGKKFTGIIGFVYYKGKEIRLATYNGAKIVRIGDGCISVSQGDYLLTAQRIDGSGHTLRAPSSGEMIRLVKENLACRSRYIFSVKNKVVFDVTSEQGSFEYEF